MRLALVFPPPMPPTSPPCGIAYLKPYINSSQTFDLNILYHETVLKMLNAGSLSVNADVAGQVLEPDNMKAAVDLFKDRKAFYDIEEYNKYCAIFLAYFRKIDSFFREECMKYFFEDSAGDELLALFHQLSQPVTDFSPDVVGFSQLTMFQREFILGLAKYLKAEDISIIVGGASLSQNPETYLSVIGVRNEVDLSTVFDAAFYGEGEAALKAYLEGESLEGISNLVYRKGGRIIKNEESGIRTLDVLPTPDFSGFPLDKYCVPYPVVPLLTSRGCYWGRCTFCIHHKSYYAYRVRAPPLVIKDIKSLYSKGIRYFQFVDEMIHPRRFRELGEAIVQDQLHIRYCADAKPTRDFSEELLKKIYESGARVLMWGVESGVQRILDLIDKGTVVADVENVLRNSHNAGIWNMIFMIIGYPTQTLPEVEEDISFLLRNEPYISTYTRSLFQLEEGSRMHERQDAFGIQQVERSRDPFSAVCQYTTREGVSRSQAESIYVAQAQEWMGISKVSPYFGKLRDHMLLYADHLSENPLEE
ncbi:MAG: radical SAM protein [Candidatus Methanofastidiosia archaeon]